MTVNCRVLAIILLLFLVVSGCFKGDKEQLEITKILSTRSHALNSKNIYLYRSLISSSYSDKGKNFEQLIEGLQSNFRTFNQLVYIADSPSINIIGRYAESTCSYRLKIVLNGKETFLNGTEHLKFAKEKEGWKIIAGI